MTTSTLTRCESCGQHRDSEEFAGGEVCAACHAKRPPARSAERHPRARRSRTAPKHLGPKAPTPELESMVRRGRAAWHRCDGADAHPDHRALHRRGFWSEGHRAVRFIETMCVYPDGPLLGQKVGETGGMIPWQREATYQVFTLRLDGHRQYRRVLIGVAKKNNKTGWAAWLAEYVLVDDLQPSGQIVCAAASEDQADLVYGFGKMTAELSPELNELTGGDGRASTRYEKEILLAERPQKSLKRLAVGGGKLDGRNLIFVVEDELHEWVTPKSEDTHTVLNRGTILQRDSIVFMITTAGFDPETIEGQLHEHGMQVLAGDVDDETFLMIWYEAPEVCSGDYEGTGEYEGAAGEPCDYRSREFFDAANPSAGLTVTYDRYLEDLNDPKMTEGVARRYHGNQHTEAEEIWTPEPWAAYAAPKPFRVDPQRRVVASIDASTSIDSTAVTWWEVTGRGGDVSVRSRSRVWERPIDPRTGRPVERWRLPQVEVQAHLYSMHFGTRAKGPWQEGGMCACCGEEFRPLGLEKIGFDTSRITMQTQTWEQDGLPMEEIPQQGDRMVRGFQTFFELLVDRRFQHDGNRVVGRHIRASSLQMTSSGGRRIVRKQETHRRPIDAATTQAMCGYLITEPETKTADSVYERRGLRRL